MCLPVCHVCTQHKSKIPWNQTDGHHGLFSAPQFTVLSAKVPPRAWLCIQHSWEMLLELLFQAEHLTKLRTPKLCQKRIAQRSQTPRARQKYQTSFNSAYIRSFRHWSWIQRKGFGRTSSHIPAPSLVGLRATARPIRPARAGDCH